jgi:hypothetical protein
MARFQNSQNDTTDHMAPRDNTESSPLSGQDIIEGAVRDTFSVERPSNPNGEGVLPPTVDDVFKSQELTAIPKKKLPAETVRASAEQQYEQMKNYARHNSIFNDGKVLRNSLEK